MIKQAIAPFALLLATVSAVQAQPAVSRPATPPPAKEQCFRSEDYQGFRPVDEHAFNIRVNIHDYYRIEVEGSCPALTYPDATLITVVRGSDMICSPLDWDLKVGQGGLGHFAEPCIVKSQTKLTPEQAAAIPKSQKP
jgi:hypothetical protein